MIVLTHEIIQLVKDNHAWIVLTKSLAMRASFDEYQKSFPSLNTICQDSGLSKPTVIKALSYLENLGILRVIRNKTDKGNYLSNQYFIETDKIQTIGKLKLGGVVKEIDKGSKSDLQGVVKEVYSNHKPSLTLNPNNESTPLKKLNEFLNSPMYGNWKSTIFPNLSDDEIKVSVQTYLTDYPEAKSTSITNYLRELNTKTKKPKDEDYTSRTAKAMEGRFTNAVNWD